MVQDSGAGRGRDWTEGDDLRHDSTKCIPPTGGVFCGERVECDVEEGAQTILELNVSLIFLRRWR